MKQQVVDAVARALARLDEGFISGTEWWDGGKREEYCGKAIYLLETARRAECNGTGG